MGRILVITESMLDVWWHCSSNRKNPESEAPLFKIDEIQNFAGGGANVAVNAKSLGSSVSICTLIGNDEKGEILLNILKDWGIDCSFVRRGGQTIEKSRLIHDGEYKLRLDSEFLPKSDFIQQFTDALIIASEIEKRIKEFDVVILTDYGKHFLSEELIIQVIDICDQNGVFCIVDPKGDDLSRYANCDLLCPNQKEASELTQEEDMDKAATTILKSCKRALITRSEHGMVLFQQGERKEWPALCKKENFRSCVGAGDGLNAGIAHFLSTGETLEDAIEKTNILLGSALQQTGTIILKP